MNGRSRVGSATGGVGQRGGGARPSHPTGGGTSSGIELWPM
jgi:hypothetical protein